jgi:hypothetical protein
MDEPIPVGEVIWPEYQIEFNWLEDDSAKRIPIAPPRVYPADRHQIVRRAFEQCRGIVWGFPFFAADAAPPIKTGKPPPTGILNVHEGRVVGIPMCAE